MSSTATVSTTLSDRRSVSHAEARAGKSTRMVGRGAPNVQRSAQGRGSSRFRAARSRLGRALVRLYRAAAPESGSRVERVEVQSPQPEAVADRTVEAATPPATDGSSDAPDAAVTERRAFPRRVSICLISVYCQPDDSPVNQQEVRWLLHSSPLRGAIDDISMNGVAFHLREPIEPGEKLLMRLMNRRLDAHFDTSGRVVRCTPDGMGEWRIVCRFDRNLTLDQVHDYGQNLFSSKVV